MHGKQLGVRGPLAAAGNEVAWANIANARPDRFDTSGGTIAERRKRFEPVPDGGHRRADPFALNLIEDLPHLVWSPLGLSKEALSSDLHFRSLRARADERGARSHEHLPLIELRRGNVEHPEFSVLHPLR
jgi:hypothetical protein